MGVAGQGRGFPLPREPEVPLELEQLSLGVADHSFPVTPELGVVGRQQGQPGDGPVPERVDDGGVAVDGLDLPVGGHRAQVHHTHTPLRRLWLLFELLDLVGHSDLASVVRIWSFGPGQPNGRQHARVIRAVAPYTEVGRALIGAGAHAVELL